MAFQPLVFINNMRTERPKEEEGNLILEKRGR